MKTQILENINNPEELEKLFRGNKALFQQSFNEIYPQIGENQHAAVWNARLNYVEPEPALKLNRGLVVVIISAIVAIIIAKLPEILNIEEDIFYPRNISFVVIPALTAWFAYQRKTSSSKLIIILAVLLIAAIYINLIPGNDNSDGFILASIHLPLLLWFVLGYCFVSDEPGSLHRRMGFLQYNGELVIMTGLLLITGGILIALSLGMFDLINVNAEDFYVKYVIISGLAVAPVIANWLVQNNPNLVNKVSPAIAKIFTPLVLLTLITYLAGIVITGKNPYQDREFLLLFNIMLIAVLAIIVFSVAEIGRTGGKAFLYMLSMLAILAIIINGIALSAIIFRISEWGFTPNRTAVLGGNIIMLIHLLLVTTRLLQVLFKGSSVTKIEKTLTAYLPVYAIWAAMVVIVFPWI